MNKRSLLSIGAAISTLLVCTVPVYAAVQSSGQQVKQDNVQAQSFHMKHDATASSLFGFLPGWIDEDD